MELRLYHFTIALRLEQLETMKKDVYPNKMGTPFNRGESRIQIKLHLERSWNQRP